MAILIDRSTQVLVQGITGSMARSETELMLKYGTKVVAGVRPGKEGEQVAGVPIYSSVARALENHRVDAVVNYVPGKHCHAAAMEAIEAGIPLIMIAAEHVPVHDFIDLFTEARRKSIRILGPNSMGIATVDEAILGGVAGSRAREVLRRGPVGVISTSGGMSVEIAAALSAAGPGVSTLVATGGEAVMGTSFREVLELFQQDPDTKGVALFVEPGSRYERDVADYLKTGAFTKPIAAIVTGRFTENLPGVQFGHSRTIVEGFEGRPSTKVAELGSAGVVICRRVSELVAASRF